MNSNLIGNILTALVIYLLGKKALEGIGILTPKKINITLFVLKFWALKIF